MPEESSSADKQELFLNALVNGDYEDFKNLFRDPAVDVEYKYGKPHYKTALEIACRRRDREEFVRLLLTKVKPNINRIVPEPIHYAAEKGLPKTLKLLLSDKRVKVNAEDSDGKTALHRAAKYFNTDDDSHEKCIQLLMMHPEIDINKPSRLWYTPIHEAASSCKQAVVAILSYARQDLDLDRYRASGRTARETIEIKYPELKDSLPLPSKAVTQASDPEIQLINALRNRYTDLFRVLLKQQDSNGNNLLDPNHWYGRPLNITPLEMACRESGCEVFVKTLLEAGANPNMVNRVSEKSPIHVAVESGNVGALNVLLGCEATDVNATDKVGKSALHYAVSQDLECDNYSMCLQALLNSEKIDINLQDSGGFTPVMLAVLRSNRKALELIIDQKIHGVDFDSAPITHSTPRKLISDIFPDLLSKLPRYSLRLKKEPDYTTVLYQYLHKQQVDRFVALLKERVGENISRKSFSEKRPETLLQCACKYGLKEAVSTLLDEGFSPNEITKENKCPPIVAACMKKDYEVLKLLLHTYPKIDVNASDMKGNTALHYTAKNSDLESSILLLTYGANPKSRNSIGKYPMNAKDIRVILDKCINDNEKFPNDEEYEVVFDYRFLTSYSEDQCDVLARRENSVVMEMQQLNQKVTYDSRPKVELHLMHFMTQSKEYRELLAHPIILSFLDLKWRKLKLVSYVNIVIYLIFLVSLNVYVSPYGRQNVMNEHENTTLGNGNENITGGEPGSCPEPNLITRILLWISLFMLCIRELLQLKMSYKRYLESYENYLDLTIIIFTVVRMANPACQDGEILRLITAALVLLSWTELLLLIGRVSMFAKNIEMLRLVLRNYLSVSLFYSIIFLAFVMSFHVLLWNVQSEENWYDSFPMSVLKTFIMITGEFDADKSYFQSISVAANLLFVLFVMIISIVILNLLIGIAVNDTQSIQNDAELLYLETRVKVAWEMEKILAVHHQYFGKDRCFFRDITIFPRRSKEKIGRVHPNESTFMKLSLRKVPFKLNSNVLDKALKIIHKRIRQAEPKDKVSKQLELENKVNSMATTLEDLLEIMKKNQATKKS